jgi:hypothetical protein
VRNEGIWGMLWECGCLTLRFRLVCEMSILLRNEIIIIENKKK